MPKMIERKVKLAMLKSLKDGADPKDVAEANGVSLPTVYRIRSAPKKSTSYSDFTRQRAIDAVSGGASIRAAARMCGVSFGAVWYWVHGEEAKARRRKGSRIDPAVASVIASLRSEIKALRKDVSRLARG